MWNILKRIGVWTSQLFEPTLWELRIFAAEHALNNATAKIEELRAQLAQAEIDLADKAFYVREFAAVSAERDALRAQPSSDTGQLPEDQVVALARVFRDEHAKVMGTDALSYGLTLFCAYARAAIAHLAKRPEGLPTAEEIKAAHLKYVEGYRKGENDGSMCATDFALDYLRPWLRDPVGFELDVHPDQLDLYKWVTEPDGGYAYAAQQAINLCRSRIKPVYECKECAKLRDDVAFWKRENVDANEQVLAAIAVLQTPRAALEANP